MAHRLLEIRGRWVVHTSIKKGLFMREFSVAFAALFLVQVGVAVGKTVYVDNSCGQNGNGTTTTCGANGPYNIIDNALAACGSLVGGDVINIRAGTGVYRERAFHIGSCRGSQGNPIIIQNYAGENVLVEGTVDGKNGQTWTSRGNGVYECTSGSACSAVAGKVIWHAWYKINNGTERELVLDHQGLSSCTSTSEAPGFMGTVSSNGNMCVNIDGATSPSAATVTSFMVPTMTDFAEPFASSPNGGRHTTWRRNPSGGSFTIRRFRDHIFVMTPTDDPGYTLDGLTVGWVYDRCINVTKVAGSAAAGFRFLNNTVSYCGQEGIRFDADTSSSGLVKGNDISHIQDPAVFPLNSGTRYAYDNCTPIRVASASNATIQGNVIHDTCGGGTGGARAIDLESNNIGHTVDGNFIYNMHGAPALAFANAAIRISSSGTGAEQWSNNTIRNNRIYDVDNCFAFDGQNFANTGSGNLVVNNTCAEPKMRGIYGYSAGLNNVGIDFKNNLFVDTQGAAPTAFVELPSSGFGGLTKPVYGAYNCTTCAANATIISFKGSTASNTHASVIAFDGNSDYGTINIAESGSPPTLALTACGDIACNKGVAVAAVPLDFFGSNRPQGGAYDIGASEYASGGLPAPVLLSAEVVPGQ
jgi:hypothetical protein